MSTRHANQIYAQSLHPFPEGWYFVASRKEILKAKLVQKTWMGENIIIWSDDDGRICVADAYCPHLGSDLGPAAGGRVCAGRLVCPFHGFEYDATGQCVSTPYAEPPRTARLGVFPTREINGLIFAWWGIEGRNPQWHLPAAEPDQTGWCDTRITTIRFPGHPQETTENSVDLAHLRYVHGYHGVKRIGRMSVDGVRLDSNFEFKTVRKIAKFASLTLHTTAITSIYGLGYSYVEIREHTIGMDLRLWVLATPVDGDLMDVSLASQIREIRNPKRAHNWARLPPAKVARAHNEPVYVEVSASGRAPGRCNLEPEAIRFPSAPQPRRRRNHALPRLLRPILSRAARRRNAAKSRGGRSRALSNFLGLMGRVVTARPWVTIAVIVLITIVMGAGANFRAAPTEGADVAFLPPGHPLATASEEISDLFTHSSEVNVVTLIFRGEALTPEGLSQMDDLLDEIVRDPAVAALLTPVDPLIAPSSLVGAVLQVDDFQGVTQAQIDSVRDVPQIQAALSAMTGNDADGTAVAIATIRLTNTGDERVADAEWNINDLAVADDGPLEVRSLSPAVVEREYTIATEQGMGPLIALALLLIVLLLFLFTRAISDMLLTLAGLIFSIVWVVGAEGWLGPNALGLIGPPSSLTALVPVIVISLTVDYAIQAVSHYREQRIAGKKVSGRG